MREEVQSLLIIGPISFSALIVLTLVFLFFANIYFTLTLLLYTFITLMLVSIRHSKTYIVVLPAPYLGSWVISLMFFNLLGIPFPFNTYLISTIPAILVTVTHIFLRKRNMRAHPLLSLLSKLSLVEASTISLLIGLLILSPEAVELGLITKVSLYIILLAMFCLSSVVNVNAAYRYREICRISKTNTIEGKINAIWGKLTQKFPHKKDDVELLKYYFLDAINLYEEGSYETSFLSAYKIIREPTIVNPSEYISDKREGEPASFSEIRVLLMHSRRKDTQINPKRIQEIKTKLPQYTLEAIERAIKLFETLASNTKNFEEIH